MEGFLIEIGGVEDHIHMLISLPPKKALADFIREIKTNSSKWCNDLNLCLSHFEWQKGYGIFTVSYSQVESVRSYIQNQAEHHKNKNFEEEYLNFLNKHQITYDSRFLFEVDKRAGA